MQQDSKQIVKGLPRRILLMLLDCGLIVFCYWLAVMLRFDSGDAYRRVEILRAMAPMLYYALPIYMIVFWFGGLYEIMWEYAGMRDLARLTCLSGLATGIIMLFDLIYRQQPPISGAVMALGAVFNTAAIAGVRFLWRLIKTVRGVLPVLARMMKDDGLEFIAALNTEPGEAGKSGLVGPMVYLGTLGKLMPSFYMRGRGAHVGNCYDGFSAALAVSRLVCAAEGNRYLADPLHGVCEPSWICLDMKVLRENYSVTVPDRAYAYFNCFTTGNTPEKVMNQMSEIFWYMMSTSSVFIGGTYPMR